MCTNRDLRILESGHDSDIARIIPQDITGHPGTATSHAPDATPAILPARITYRPSFDEEIHQFIEGPLLYILIVLFFLTLFVKNRLLAKAASQDEWLPIVNEKGEVVGKATRRSCHSGSMLLHPVVHLHLINEQGDIYLQKRSMKKNFLPGMWDTAVGGHVALGEKIEDALKRETFEELGITKFKARFLGSYVWESSRERELVFPFLCTSHDAIHINNDEVDEGRFWSRKEIEQNAAANIFTPNFLHEYNHLLKKIK